jgi:glycerol kinase
MSKRYILALDQGTTSSRAILFDKKGNIISLSQKEFTQIYPHPGWIEHNPEEIWKTQIEAAKEAIQKVGLSPSDIASIGITNQRETTVLWDKNTGRSVYNAIVWQCRRTADLCDKIKAAGLSDYIRENTGLIVDAYFSATKIKWILDNIEGMRQRAEKGDILFGNIDSCLSGN